MKLQLAFLAASAAICQAYPELLGLPVLTKMAERFATRVTAVNNLHSAALAADTTNFNYWPLCCDNEAFTEIFHSNYGRPVDSTLACRRGPCTLGVKDTNRTADMPSFLGGTPACGNSVLGQKFYDACNKNMGDYNNHNEGISWQFWGAETGLFLVYPGVGTGLHCESDTYECRKRAWYKQAQDSLGTSNKDSVHFSSPYIGFDGNVLMVTAFRSVSSAEEDSIFQGVVGIDMDITYLMEPLADIDAIDDSYSFVVDGTNGKIMSHPKLSEVPNFIETGKHAVKYTDVEPELAIQHFITEMLGNESGWFTMDMVRYKTYRNDILDSEDVPSAAEFWDHSVLKENVQVTCFNFETTGGTMKYIVCAVRSSGNMQLHIVLPILMLCMLACCTYFGSRENQV